MVIAGPRLMEDREALQLQQVLIVYNFSSVLFSMWMMWEFLACTFLNPNFNLLCEDADERDRSPEAMRLVNAQWWYFLSKFIELLDTAFFVLRKKSNQLSFLHCYHHFSMLTLQWCVVKFVPGGASYFTPLLNCFVHTLMYTYYLLSAFGPHMQTYLWWKKYLTSVQMIQFILNIVYAVHLLRTGCRHWGAFIVILLFFDASLFFLFAKFYIRSFKQRKEREE